MNKKIKTIGLLSVSAFALTGCLNSFQNMRGEVSDRIAGAAFMAERQIDAEPFALTAFERMHEKNAPATVYIEGDGVAWLSKRQRSLNPTPKNPVALHLASRDDSKNLVYLARPCQYSGMIDTSTKCHDKYWTSHRFAPEVIDSFNRALDEIKQRYKVTSFHLVGFSGGANLAGLLAAQRQDILSLRTVAGNMDHRLHSQIHEVSELKGSLNAVDYADALSNLPQHHFVGALDDVVPETIIKTYQNQLSHLNCSAYTVLPKATHEQGWVNDWHMHLVEKRPMCKTYTPAPFQPIPPKETVYVPRMSGKGSGK